MFIYFVKHCIEEKGKWLTFLLYPYVYCFCKQVLKKIKLSKTLHYYEYMQKYAWIEKYGTICCKTLINNFPSFQSVFFFANFSVIMYYFLKLYWLVRIIAFKFMFGVTDNLMILVHIGRNGCVCIQSCLTPCDLIL